MRLFEQEELQDEIVSVLASEFGIDRISRLVPGP
jgi:hypothetical protein